MVATIWFAPITPSSTVAHRYSRFGGRATIASDPQTGRAIYSSNSAWSTSRGNFNHSRCLAIHRMRHGCLAKINSPICCRTHRSCRFHLRNTNSGWLMLRRTSLTCGPDSRSTKFGQVSHDFDAGRESDHRGLSWMWRSAERLRTSTRHTRGSSI